MTTPEKLGGYCRTADAIVPVREAEPCEFCGATQGHYPGYRFNGKEYEVIVVVRTPPDPPLTYEERFKRENYED